MDGHRIGLLLAATASLLICATVASGAGHQAGDGGESEIPFPEGFRHWAHVKSAVVTDTPQTAAFSGLHNIYANEQALGGYRSGTFADGSVIVFDNFEIQAEGNALRPGRRRSTDVMARDRSADGGWRFESFAGGNPAARSDAQRKAVCRDCHLREPEGDGVFSVYHD